MSELKDRLRADLTTAMKQRDGLRASTLRMALAAVTNAEVAGKQARELSDDEVVGVLVTEAKKRSEAAAAYDGAGRGELAAKERAESEVLADYLPQPLSQDELTELVTAAVESQGAAGKGLAAMGPVMGQLKPQVTGRAAGAAVAAEVRRQLTTG
ncbi:GatB/YqeY domain-containing protein [soil metagenome]